MERTELMIGGMGRGHCVRAVPEALRAVEGARVEQVAVGSAEVSYDPAAVPAERTAAAVEDEGYEVQSMRRGS